MSQVEAPESGSKTVEAKETPGLSLNTDQTKKTCVISDNVKDRDDKVKIRSNLCQHTEIYTHTDGEDYCLFHLPTKEKKIKDFNDKFFERLEAVETASGQTEEPTGDNQKSDEEKAFYDFRYVWFPDAVKLPNYKFIAAADFSSATFTSDVDFNSATFTSTADFGSATFISIADFISTTFISGANFISTTFESIATFSSAVFIAGANYNRAKFKSNANFVSTSFMSPAFFSSTAFESFVNFITTRFLSKAHFRLSTFKSSAYFLDTVFASVADFTKVKFETDSEISFYKTLFCSSANFSRAEIEGSAEFGGNAYPDKEKFEEIKRELENHWLKLKKELTGRGMEIVFPAFKLADEPEIVLNFQNVKLKNPERISFNSTTLRPNWFVNVDETRKINFNDIKWLNIDIDIDRAGLDSELKSLEKRKVVRRERSLIKVFNQLADIAEVNHRSDEARRFRKQSLALEEMSCHIHFSIDTDKKNDIREKVCRKYPVVNEDDGNYYCLWHDPDKKKAEIFLREFKKHQANGHSDFRAVIFPITVEYSPVLEDDKGNKVEIASPEKLNFTGATFQRGLIFQNKFEIKNLDLTHAYFEETADLDFKDAICRGRITLDKSVFDGKLFLRKHIETFFQNPFSALTMRDVRFEKPENANFDSVRLRPHYFIDVDASKFNFHDCDWNNEDGGKLIIEEEIQSCGKHKTLAQISNHLAVNYEENRDYEQSSNFRYMAMEARRLEYKNSISRFVNIYWIYKVTSGYGEKWRRALIVLLLLLSGFSILYATHLTTFEPVNNIQAGDISDSDKTICEKYRMIGNAGGMSVCDAVIHSLAVASFQKPDPKPKDTFTKFLVTLETILAPLQAALLALAIRRKFMR